MEIFQANGAVWEDFQGGVVVLGNFDGVHRGHQIVLGLARELAKKKSLPFGVMTFEPHPRAFFSKGNIFRLSPPNIKPLLFEVIQADFLQIYDFDRDFSSLSARKFVEKTLLEHLNVSTVVCGYDFHFGKGREGSPEALQELGSEYGFDVKVVPVQKSDSRDRVFSSSSIREDLRNGDVASAAQDLGRWWSIRGKVETGEGQGKFLGFPTANIPLDPTCELKPGIYAARLRILGEDSDRVFGGAAYIGTKPTFGDFQPRLEIFLFDFDGDIYSKDVLVEFVEYIREDQRFDSPDALTAQMEKDCESANKILQDLSSNGDPMSEFETGRFFTPKE